MTYSSFRGFAPTGSPGVAGEIPSPPIDPNAPVISNYDFARGFLFFIQGLASVALVGLFAIQIYGMLFWDASGRHLPLLEIVFGVYANAILITVNMSTMRTIAARATSISFAET